MGGGRFVLMRWMIVSRRKFGMGHFKKKLTLILDLGVYPLSLSMPFFFILDLVLMKC